MTIFTFIISLISFISLMLLFIKNSLNTIKSRLYYHPVSEQLYWCNRPSEAIQNVYINIGSDKLHGLYYCPESITYTTKIILICHGNS